MAMDGGRSLRYSASALYRLHLNIDFTEIVPIAKDVTDQRMHLDIEPGSHATSVL